MRSRFTRTVRPVVVALLTFGLFAPVWAEAGEGAADSSGDAEEETSGIEKEKEALRQAHEQRMIRLEQQLEIARERGREDMIEEAEERIANEVARYEAQVARIEERHSGDDGG